MCLQYAMVHQLRMDLPIQDSSLLHFALKMEFYFLRVIASVLLLFWERFGYIGIVDYLLSKIPKIYNYLLRIMQNSQEFEPTSFFQASQENYFRPKKQQKYVSGEKNGKWSQLQHTKYIAFIEHNKDKMRSKEKRRVSKFYKEMANYIKTRNAFQCRSHHQKLEDRHYFPNKIIAHYKKNNDLTLYNQIKLQLEDLDPKPTQAVMHNLKLQEKKMEYVCQTQIRGSKQSEIVSVQQNSTPSSPTSNQGLCSSLNGNQYVSWQTIDAKAFWGGYFYYPFYSIN